MAFDYNKKFINPYNFLSTNEECKREKEDNTNDKLTGVINCTIKTKTPLFIPGNDNKIDYVIENCKNPNVKKHLQQNKSNEVTAKDFFSYDGVNPIIPGSSLKGVIRSIYEAATDSCFSIIDEEILLYKKSNTFGTPHIIKAINGELFIYKTETSSLYFKPPKTGHVKIFNKVDIEKKYNDSEIVCYKNGNKGIDIIEKYDEKFMEKGYTKGIILLGNDIFSKKSFKVFNLSNLSNEQSLNKEDFKRLKASVELSLETTKAYKDYYKKIKEIEATGEGVLPVYLNQVNGVKYLAPAQLIKEVYKNTISSILEDQGNYSSCKDINNLCSACNVFGTIIGEDRKESKLSFTDAKISNSSNDDIYTEYLLLNELSSPKITSTEFYLLPYKDKKTTSDINYYNYDYKIKTYTKDGKVYDKNYTPKLRGRKFYWNHNSKGYEALEKSPLTSPVVDKNILSSLKRRNIIKAIKEDVTFNFSVVFKNINRADLERLIYVLTLGNNSPNSKNYHKIGTGKPLGLGTVAITIDNINYRNIDIKSGKYELKKDTQITVKKPQELFSKDLKELSRATTFLENKNISYPVAYTGEFRDMKYVEIFKWFANNRGKLGKEIFTNELPLCTESLEMPSYNDVKVNKGKGRKW